MHTRRSTILIAATVLALPCVALANTGVGVAATGVLVVLFAGNAVVAIVETLLLVRICNTPPRSTLALLLVANYASSWLGLFPIAWLSHRMPLDEATPVSSSFAILLLTMACTIPVSLLIESPFFWTAVRFRRSERTIRRSTFAPALLHAAWINSATGIAVIGFLLLFTNIQMPLRFDERTDTAFMSGVSEHSDAWVYFTNLKGDVERVRLDGSRRETRLDLDRDRPSEWLGVYRASDGTLGVYATNFGASAIPIDTGFTHGTLPIHAHDEPWRTQDQIIERPSIESDGPFRPNIFGPPTHRRPYAVIARHDALPLRYPPDRPPYPFTAYGPFGYETTLDATPSVTSVTRLSDDHYVLCLRFARSRDPYIVVADTRRGLLGHLARGSSPVVVYGPDPSDPTPTLPTTDEAPRDPLLRPDP
ncbi:MAG: hypothetical protein AAGH64_10705 [Planctomycetota bacterium]